MDRYVLRRFRKEDFAALHAMMGEYDVVKMTGAWPWPPDPALAVEDLDEVTACVWQGNPASESVLFKHGFVKAGACEEFCIPRGERVVNNTFRLARANWRARDGV